MSYLSIVYCIRGSTYNLGMYKSGTYIFGRTAYLFEGDEKNVWSRFVQCSDDSMCVRNSTDQSRTVQMYTFFKFLFRR